MKRVLLLALFTLAISSPLLAQARYDLLIRGGHVIDPKNNIDGPSDVAVKDGNIAAVEKTIDPALAYRYACRVGMCGSCAMTVNGVSRWTCRTHVSKVAEDGRLVIVDAEQHTGYSASACAQDVVDRYLVDLAAPDDETEC